ncbi:unnamed protein product, partial [Medioppia subpectinata]
MLKMNRKTKSSHCFDFALNMVTMDEINELHLHRVYKLDSSVCKSKANKNCGQNMRCLNGLGERPWLSSADNSSNTANDSHLGRRVDGSFVGLKNLGATCYVNCLLQVWFHNPIFRSMIYRWKPEEDPEENELDTNSVGFPEEVFVPKTCIGKLQLIFALMQFGVRSSVDPKPIIKCLELDEKTHIQTKVYKLDASVCKSKANKNCGQNMRCLNGLGERPWLSSADNSSNTANDSHLGRRVDGSFVGLKNLGATCYVNCLLQVWFHNPIFRSMIYRWKPEEDPEENELDPNSIDFSEEVFVPKTCIGKLQLIFALMQFGVRSSVDPKPIIKCLELDENRQQDAHEFSNLFFSLIERKLKFQTNPNVAKVIQSQYCGKFAYITRCLTCEDMSSRESQFYELDLNIKGCKDLYDSLGDYLKVESLEGMNQYYCGSCGQKRNASRYIKLRKLPPVLNIQLLRFVFDPHIKKLNSIIRFPDILDAKPFIDSADGLDPRETTYHLSAVLIHRGPSAHSGHYIAHIKDQNTGFWYKFNDEKVEQIEGKKLKLDSDEVNDENSDTNGNVLIKNDRKGCHQSNNAYMLVYKNEIQTNTDLANNYSDWGLPQYLMDFIEKDNKSFEESIAEQMKLKEEEMCSYIERKTEINHIYEQLTADGDKPYEFISKKWLIHWLSAKPLEQIKPIDNTDLLCIHRKLNFKSLSSIKCISKSGADLLYEKYGGGPILRSNSLCIACVAKQVEVIKTKTKIEEDIKTITSQLKYTPNLEEECYWVGKESLKSWKQIKLKSIEYKNPEVNDNSDTSVEVIESNDIDFEISCLNDDIICKHGKLTPDENKRRLVSVLVWETLKCHFPNAQQYTQKSTFCEECLSYNKAFESFKTQHKEMAMNQKLILPNLLAERHRLVWDDLNPTARYYALSRKFLTSWKRFIKDDLGITNNMGEDYDIIDPSKYDPPEVIENSGLLCAHQMFLYPTNKTEIVGNDCKFVILPKDEWESLIAFYSNDFEIQFLVLLNENNDKFIESIPSFCDSCFQSLILEEERERLTYNNQFIYVRKVEKNESNSDDSHDKQEINSDGYHEKMNGKKFKKEDTKHAFIGNGENNTFQGLRRSSRRRKNKNEKEIKVSSTNTLLDLKIQIMNIFRVAPYDQNLSLNDKPLDANNKTLAELHVEPYSIITLTV